MKRSKTSKIIEKVAAREGVSVAEVRSEMQKALDIAYEGNRQDAFWDRWKSKPTLEEFISAASNEVLTRFEGNKKTPLS